MTPSTHIHWHDGPLPPAPTPDACGGGAVLVFEGVVRRDEDGRELEALEYQAYEPMTSRQLHALAQQIAEQHMLIGVHVEHSVGVVPVGRVSFRLSVVSQHRKEGLAAADRFIDTMKRDVPLWKLPRFARELAR